MFNVVEEKNGNINHIRCKIEYTQLDLNTGLEKTVKHTSQFKYNVLHFYLPKADTCYLSTQDFTDKMNTWLNENPSNIITNMTVVNCKSKIVYYKQTRPLNAVEDRWGKYKSCDDEYNINLIDWLESPKQWGFNVNKARLIRDYEEGSDSF
jgi:hypothetical protein